MANFILCSQFVKWICNRQKRGKFSIKIVHMFFISDDLFIVSFQIFIHDARTFNSFQSLKLHSVRLTTELRWCVLSLNLLFSFLTPIFPLFIPKLQTHCSCKSTLAGLGTHFYFHSGWHENDISFDLCVVMTVTPCTHVSSLNEKRTHARPLEIPFQKNQVISLRVKKNRTQKKLSVFMPSFVVWKLS